MKKMKRLMSSVLSLIVCASPIVNLSLNASAFYVLPNAGDDIIITDDGFRMIKNEKLSELYNSIVYVHDPNQTDKIWPYGQYSFEQPECILVYESLGIFGMMVDSCDSYSSKETSAEEISKYINENYSEFGTSLTDSETVLVDFPKDTPYDIKISLKHEIDKKFHLEWLNYTYEETVNCTYAGDVDNDNLLTADDASYVLEYYAKAQTDKLGEYEESRASELALYGDYDGDGIVDANDASNILAAYSKNQTK